MLFVSSFLLGSSHVSPTRWRPLSYVNPSCVLEAFPATLSLGILLSVGEWRENHNNTRIYFAPYPRCRMGWGMEEPTHPRTHAPTHPRTHAPTHPRTYAPTHLRMGDLPHAQRTQCSQNSALPTKVEDYFCWAIEGRVGMGSEGLIHDEGVNLCGFLVSGV